MLRISMMFSFIMEDCGLLDLRVFSCGISAIMEKNSYNPQFSQNRRRQPSLRMLIKPKVFSKREIVDSIRTIVEFKVMNLR